jgi:hypothetical protein
MRPLLSVMMVLGAAAPAVAQLPPPSAQLNAAFEAARAASPTAPQLEAEQREWLHYRTLDEYGYGADGDDGRAEELTRRAQRDRALREVTVASPEALGACIGSALKGCSSRAAGWLSSPDGDRLFWQLQDGYTDENGITGGFMLLSGGGTGPVRPRAWAFEGWRYEAPTLLMVEGQMYVAVAGRMAGTGNGNADALFRWSPDAAEPLVQIDNWSWREQLAERLPTGLEVWKGVDYRYADSEIWAWTKLWQPNDGNCCPSGGEASLTFELRNDALVLGGVNVNEPLLDAAMTVPTEVFDWLGRTQLCDHWQGEEGFDADRRAQIDTAVRTLRCEAVPADGAALKVRYADNPMLAALIARAAGPPAD